MDAAGQLLGYSITTVKAEFNVSGSYTVLETCEASSGATVSRQSIVRVNTPPKVVLAGAAFMKMTTGAAYSDAGAI